MKKQLHFCGFSFSLIVKFCIHTFSSENMFSVNFFMEASRLFHRKSQNSSCRRNCKTVFWHNSPEINFMYDALCVQRFELLRYTQKEAENHFHPLGDLTIEMLYLHNWKFSPNIVINKCVCHVCLKIGLKWNKCLLNEAPCFLTFHTTNDCTELFSSPANWCNRRPRHFKATLLLYLSQEWNH